MVKITNAYSGYLNMDVSRYVRDANRVHKALKEAGNTIIAIEPCKIYVPESYLGNALGSNNDTLKIVGIFGITVDDKFYGASKACALMEISPSASHTLTIENTSYMEFTFHEGDTVIKNTNLVRTGTLVYRIYNEFITKGNVPWYLTYTDMCFLFDTALLHGKADLHADSALLELIVSSMAREKEDRSKFFRHDPNLGHSNKRPLFVPLKSVAYSATNTTSKLLGSYFNEGLTSALVNQTETLESIDNLLR